MQADQILQMHLWTTRKFSHPTASFDWNRSSEDFLALPLLLLLRKMIERKNGCCNFSMLIINLWSVVKFSVYNYGFLAVGLRIIQGSFDSWVGNVTRVYDLISLNPHSEISWSRYPSLSRVSPPPPLAISFWEVKAVRFTFWFGEIPANCKSFWTGLRS